MTKDDMIRFGKIRGGRPSVRFKDKKKYDRKKMRRKITIL